MKRYLLPLLLFYIGVLTAWSSPSNVRRYTVADGLLNNQVSQLAELPNGQILVGTEGAFNLFDGRRFTVQQCRIDSLYRLPSFGTNSYLWQGDSLLWLKDYYWLYLYDARHRRFRYDYAKRIDEQPVQRFIHERADSVKHVMPALLWAKLEHLRSILPTEWHIPPLTAYLCDRQGGEWYGTDNEGIIYISPKKPRIRTMHPDVPGEPRRMAACDDSHFLLGTTEGIFLIDSKSMEVQRTLVTEHIGCMDMKRDQQGRIYVSTTQGLYRYEQGDVTHYHQGNVDGFIHMPIRLALPLPDGRVLVCNLLHHLGYLYPEEHRFRLLNARLPQLDGYRTLIEAAQQPGTGRVTVATQNGAFTLDISADTLCPTDTAKLFYAYSQKFNCVLFDSKGNLWMGSHNGLLCNGTRLTHADGLSNSSIRCMAEAPDGSIWVGTSDGINCIRDGEIFTLGASDGLPPKEITERGALIMPDGTAFFAAGSDLLTFSCTDFGNQTETMPTVITDVQVMNQTTESPDSLPLTLPYNHNYLHLTFSALYYASPEHIRYRYRMQGLDNQWLLAYNDHGGATATYNAMPPGHYRFQLQCAVRNGAWGPMLTKEIVIRPPWWQTWWARLAYALFVLAAAAIAIRAYWKRQRARIAREGEEQVNRMFEVRDEARHHFAQQLDVSPARMAMNTQEENLITHLMEVIERNMANTEYSVEQMARDVAMDRTGLYRKLQAIVGITPSEFLRSVRLKCAAQMLEDEHAPSVTEISERVGFASSRHFATCFKQMFGCTPTEYRKGKREK